MLGEQRLYSLAISLSLLGTASCSLVSRGESRVDRSVSQSAEEGISNEAENSVYPPGWIPVADVASRVEIVDLLPPRYETEDGLRPPDPLDTNRHRRYQIALASVLHDYLPSTAPQFAFVVNVTLDGIYDSESVLDTVGDIEIGDAGIVFGERSAGSRGVGAWEPYYDPTWSLPIGHSPSVRFLRETVMALRQSGQEIDALDVRDWCELSAGNCVNARSGWSATIPEFEAMIEAELALPMEPTPGPNSSYP